MLTQTLSLITLALFLTLIDINLLSIPFYLNSWLLLYSTEFVVYHYSHIFQLDPPELRLFLRCKTSFVKSIQDLVLLYL